MSKSPGATVRGGRSATLAEPFAAGSVQGLAARWVRWAASAGPFRNPVSDTDGKYAALNQPGDVWFLAGSFGTRVERRCSVPANRPLFAPLFNMWRWPAADDDVPPAVPSSFGSLRLDGIELASEVIFTPRPFPVAGAFLNPVTRGRRAVPTMVWGRWCQVAPLTSGEHEIELMGGDGHGFTVEVTYRLDVA